MRHSITTLIIDLDNTIYDWFEIWRASFNPVFAGLLAKTKTEQDELEASIRKIHQARRTSEYTFLVDELSLVSAKGGNLRELLRDELAESKAARDRTLKLYPTVLKTLWEVKRRGCRIVAYTESLSFYSAYRLKRLGLDGVIDFLYSPADHDMPAGVSLTQVRSHPDEYYELQITQVRHTPAGEIKPNPTLLRSIINDIGVKPGECVYVGDSLFKDVAMAQDAGVYDVFAEYGVAQHHSDYDLLRRVSHWTDSDVEREKAVTKREIVPSVSIDYFGEIMLHFDFVPPSGKPSEFTTTHVIDIWKKVVEVQQHFNQIEMQIRNYALTVVGAILAAAGITFRDGLHFALFGADVSVALGVLVIAFAVWGGFWFMDRQWYHRLLKGAVDHATKIELKYGSTMPEIALGTSISAASPIKFWRWRLGSNQKIDLFYGIGAVLIVVFGALVVTTGVEAPPEPASLVSSEMSSISDEPASSVVAP